MVDLKNDCPSHTTYLSANWARIGAAQPRLQARRMKQVAFVARQLLYLIPQLQHLGADGARAVLPLALRGLVPPEARQLSYSLHRQRCK